MQTYLKTKDHFLSQEEFDLRLDPHLDMLITHPQPEDLYPYYKSKNYISHTDNKKTITAYIYALVKKYAIRKKIRLLNQLQPTSKTVLDIGAGTGDFLKAAKTNHWTTTGVEPNEGAVTIALSKGITLKKNLSEITSTSSVITLWHVLEHLPNLDDQLKKITSLLQPNGYLIIAVPNYKSYDAQYYKSHWAAYDVPRHLWHFSSKSISMLLKPHGLSLIKTLPMPFDSYYVSLLSEKYKNGKSSIFPALLTGLRSNLKASRNGQYSSLIYVLKKD